MTNKELKNELITQYVNCLKSCDWGTDNEEYRAGVNYFMGWLSGHFKIDLEEINRAREKELYK